MVDIDTGQVASAAERERKRLQRIRREEDQKVITLRRMIRIQRNRIEANDLLHENGDGEVEKDARRQIVSLKRRLFRRIREIA